jgi:hypothetical protein
MKNMLAKIFIAYNTCLSWKYQKEMKKKTRPAEKPFLFLAFKRLIIEFCFNKTVRIANGRGNDTPCGPLFQPQRPGPYVERSKMKKPSL